MKATALKPFRHDRLGQIEKGEFTFSAEHLPTLRGLAFVEIHEEKPHKTAVETKPEPVSVEATKDPVTKRKPKA